MELTSGDLGVACLAVVLFGVVMLSLYLVVRAGVRAGMEDAWRRMAAGQVPPPPAPPPAAPAQSAAPAAPEQRAPEEPETAATT